MEKKEQISIIPVEIREIVNEFDSICNTFNEKYLELKYKYEGDFPINICDGLIGIHYDVDTIMEKNSHCKPLSKEEFAIDNAATIEKVAIVEDATEQNSKLFSLRICNRTSEAKNVAIKFDDSLNSFPEEGVSVYVESDTSLSLQDLTSIISKVKIQVTHVKISGLKNTSWVGIPSLGIAGEADFELTPATQFTIKGLESFCIIDFYGVANEVAGNFKSRPIALTIKNNSGSKIENFEFLQANKYYPDNRHIGNGLHFEDVTISSNFSAISYQCILGEIQKIKAKISRIMVMCADGFSSQTYHMTLHQYDMFGMQAHTPISFHKLFFNNNIISTLGADNNFHLDACTGLKFTLEPYKKYDIYIYLRSDLEQSKNDGSESKFGTKVDIV